jgi:peroxiredoxin
MTILLVASSEAQIAINITLKGLNGDKTKLADNIGEKIILINFWATWCLPCIKELPHLQKIHETFQDEDFIMFAISVDGPGTLAQVKSFLNRNSYKFAVLLDTESKVSSNTFLESFLPYTILIDKEGQIHHMQQG